MKELGNSYKNEILKYQYEIFYSAYINFVSLGRNINVVIKGEVKHVAAVRE